MTIETAKRSSNTFTMWIPSNLATNASLVESHEVMIEVQDNQPRICTYAAIPQFSRARLIQQFEEGKLKRHDEIDFGCPVGDEWGGPEDPTGEGIE
jgi:antitoxin MazE